MNTAKLLINTNMTPAGLRKIPLAQNIEEKCSRKTEVMIEQREIHLKELVESQFQGIGEKISPESFGIYLRRILGDNPRIPKLLNDASFRKKIYKGIDNGKSQKIQDGISEGRDLKLIFEEIQLDEIFDNRNKVGLLIAYYDAGRTGKSINTWSNDILGTNLQKDTLVIYDKNEITYYNAKVE